MRRDRLYLTDIVEAVQSISHFLEGVRREDFVGDDLRRSAVLLKLVVIGEAAARLSHEFRGRHAEVQWSDIVAFRNIAVHAYFSINWSTVWVAATEEAPALATQVARILAEEFPEAPLPKPTNSEQA